MSQENLSQQQQQQHQSNNQQVYQNNNFVGNVLQNSNVNSLTNNSNNINSNTYNQVAPNAERDGPIKTNTNNDMNQQQNSYTKIAMPQQSVTISTQLQQEQLEKLQNQAANNFSNPEGSDLIKNTSQTSSVSNSSSTMINLTGAIPKVDYESGEETEEENEVLEESPEGRWIKRNESVSQRDVPGIDQAFLAMDTEYGIEVVWNEINLLGGKKLRNSHDEVKINLVFEHLISLNHPNIVKFHKYWRDKNKKLPRIIFITEYMSSGSLKQFLRKAKRTNQPIKKSTWKRWCIQLLTALHYLHNSETPIIHGNLSGETIFIQHNGLIKIGSIAPDIVNAHVKTCIDNSWWTKNRHFMAPELHEIYNIEKSSSNSNQITNNLSSNINTTSNSTNTLQVNNSNSNYNQANLKFYQNQSTAAVDVYSFGMVALEMFNLELGGNGDTHAVTPELIKQSIDTLDAKQRDFINKCLQKDPLKRPNAKELLFHPLLFEVPSLRLLAAHEIIKNVQNEYGETNTERIFNDSDFRREPDYVIASTNRLYNIQVEIPIQKSNSNSSLLKNNNNKSLSSSASNSTSSSSNSLSSSPTLSQQKAQGPVISKYFDFKYSLLNQFEANKYLEDVKNGIYPLTAYGLNTPTPQEVVELEPIAESNFIETPNNNYNDILPTVFNNDAVSYNVMRTSLSPSSRSLSGTNTSLASTNLSSASSSSSTSPSQSLSQVVLQQGNNNNNNTSSQVNAPQQQQQVNQNQNFEQHVSYVKPSYSPPVSNLILNNNLMLNNISQAIQNSTLPPVSLSGVLHCVLGNLLKLISNLVYTLKSPF
jgi:serine/threonine protein kinase